MEQTVGVKICGLTSEDQVAAAAQAGARYVGFVFFEKSPRHVQLSQAARLAAAAPAGLCKVALTVNASDDDLAAILQRVPVDLLQLHGAESRRGSRR